MSEAFWLIFVVIFVGLMWGGIIALRVIKEMVKQEKRERRNDKWRNV